MIRRLKLAAGGGAPGQGRGGHGGEDGGAGGGEPDGEVADVSAELESAISLLATAPHGRRRPRNPVESRLIIVSMGRD